MSELAKDIFNAAKQGDINTISRLLTDATAEELNYEEKVDYFMMTGLLAASSKGHVEVVQMLLQSGKVHVDQKDSKVGSTAQLIASSNGNVEVVKLLLQYNADVSIQNKDGYTALHKASSNGHVEVVKLLLQNNADVNVQDKYGLTALLKASINGHVEVVQLLLQINADVNIKGENEWTALYWASRNGHVKVVKLLLQYNADVNIKNMKNGETALDVAKTPEIKKLIQDYVNNRKKAAEQEELLEEKVDSNEQKQQTGHVKGGQDSISPPAVSAVDLNKDAAPDMIAAAIKRGSKEWRRSKLSFVGEGRAGKTAVTNSVIGRAFEQTASTVGINQLTCDVKQVKTGGAQGQEQRWAECVRQGPEWESAIAEMVAASKHKKADAAVASGTDIRAYMASLASAAVRAVAADPDDEEGATGAIIEEEARSVTATSKERNTPTVATTTATTAPDKVSQIKQQTTTAASSFPVPTLPSHAPSAAYQKATVKQQQEDAHAVERVLDEAAVMKMLATMEDADTGMMISLFDYGGQSVFDVIHHLFLTRNGVYALVFNMEWLVKEGPEKDKALRFMRNWLSSIAVHTYSTDSHMTAPIVIVGTRLDKITSAADHEKISTILHEHFSDNLAWRSVISNEEGRDSNGKALQWFFPVNNTLGASCGGLKRLMSVVHGVIDKAEYTHKHVPLTWLKVIDQMADTKKDCLLLSELTTLCRQNGVSANELTYMLTFLHDVGHLMWLDEPGLRDVVVLDPVSYLVTPATIIICKLTPDQDDTTHHLMQSHRECERLHKREWMQLKRDGVLHTLLLSVLWRDYAAHQEVLLQLMVKFGLLVPLRTQNITTITAADAVTQYLVPTLLSPASLLDPSVAQWTDHRCSSCYLVFTLAEELEQSSTLTEADLRSAGFLPGGMFERIVGKALSWSQDTARGSSINLQSVPLHKDVAVLAFGGQRFRLVHCADLHCVRVDIEGDHPIGIQQKDYR